MKPRSIPLLILLVLALAASLPMLLGAFCTARSAGEIRRSAHVALDAGGEPEVVVESTRYEFGTMDVGQQGEHCFTVRNVGNADLELWQGKTTCSCTVSQLGDDDSTHSGYVKIPAGGESQVRLRWTPPKPAELFAQGATIRTNDPQQPSVYLSVVGAVRSHLAVSTDSIVFSDIPVGESATKRFVVYSQAWEDFELQATCPDEHIAIDIQEAGEASLAPLEAKSGYIVQVTLSPGLKPGRSVAQVSLSATSSGNAVKALRRMSVPVGIQIASSVWLEGPNLIETDLLKLGTVPFGAGKKRRMALFVRGDEDVHVTSVQSRPAFLKVQVGERQEAGRNLARYPIDVEIPQQAPATACVGNQMGEIRLSTDHPEVPELRLKVDFVVMEGP